MIHEEDEWCTIIPDNLTLFKCEFGKTAVDYLWELIEEAQENPEDYKPGLAGNISESLILKDHDDYFFNNHLRQAAILFAKNNPNICAPFAENHTEHLRLQSLWVNLQLKHDFNPAHHHNGVMSFVIWMKIPTRHEEQYSLPISANSNNPCASDFEFLYSNILGHISRMDIKMDPEMEGTMFMFPSALMHQVYPFFNSDETRVSISGNIGLNQQ
tara:strand:+ start:816 stop:1457 length:642 start_codon:yes stop_codon:yes gene_type:complete